MKGLTTFLAERSTVASQHGDFSVAILENPRVVFSEADIQDFISGVIDEIHVVAAQSFGVDLKDQSREGIHNHVLAVDSLVFLHQQDEIVGFASARLFPSDEIFHLYGVAISPVAKGNRAGTILVKALAYHAGMRWIAFTTQNPLMFCLLRSLVAEVFPSPKQREVPSSLREMGMRLVRGRPGNLDPSTFIIRGLYDKCLYGSLPISRDSNVNRWFADALNVMDGVTRDGFLFVGERV
jgi:hypothetical protein